MRRRVGVMFDALVHFCHASQHASLDQARTRIHRDCDRHRRVYGAFQLSEEEADLRAAAERDVCLTGTASK